MTTTGNASMKKVTIKVPHGDQKTLRVERYIEVTGVALGPFIIHESVDGLSGWVVTHAASGFAIQKRIPRKDRALWLAGELNGYPVWDFTTPKGMNIPTEILEKISQARAAVMRPVPNALLGGLQP